MTTFGALQQRNHNRNFRGARQGVLPACIFVLAMIQVFGRIIYRAFNLDSEVFTRFDIRVVVRIPNLDTLRECGRDGERGESYE